MVSVRYQSRSSIKWHCEQDPFDEKGNAISRPVLGMPEEFWETHRHELAQGNRWIEIESSGWTLGVRGGAFTIAPGSASPSAIYDHNPRSFGDANKRRNHNRALAKKIGGSAVLVLRISGLDSSVTPSAEVLAQAIFGLNGGDLVNPAAQVAFLKNGRPRDTRYRKALRRTAVITLSCSPFVPCSLLAVRTERFISQPRRAKKLPMVFWTLI